MDHQSAEQASFALMGQARGGEDISRRYNSLDSEEQRQVFSEMKTLQLSPETSKLFGNIELFDNNHDGRMDDAVSTGKDGSKHDVYDDRNQPSDQSRSKTGDYVRAEAERPAAEDVRPAQQAENNRTARNSSQRSADENTPKNPVVDRMERGADNAVRRAGQIVLDEALRGINRRGGHGPDVGDRIGNRMQRESVTGANRAIRDILRRR